MKVTYNWLNEYVDLSGLSAEAIAEALTMAGLEVETVQPLGRELEAIRVGRILEVEKHPEADKLTLCRVDAGSGPVTIVCGAPNVRPGLLVPVATPGTTTPSGQQIEVATIRRHTSYGMLCSERELGLSEDHTGIMILPEGLTPGMPLSRALELEDVLLDVSITPNRADCLSHGGIAREIAAIYDRPLRLPALSTDPVGEDILKHTSVTLSDPDLCPRYAAGLLFDVTIGPSPRWLRQRLEAVGVRSINNIVDVTNFVLLETGQPLHAFDFDRLAGHRIMVRRAQDRESFITLDGVTRTLTGEMLVIADAEKSVALAGIMGGQESEIQPETRNVLLESAFFDPVSIRRTAKHLGMSTEASVRFERGIDLEGVLPSARRALTLMQEVGGGRPAGGLIDVYPRPAEIPPIRIDIRQAGRFLGLPVSSAQALDIGRRLGLPMQAKTAEILEVRPPSFRRDLTRPVDILEELARMIGYDRIPVTVPRGVSSSGQDPEPVQLRRSLATLLTGLGFDEIVTYSFINEAGAVFFLGAESADRVIRLSNPISEDQTVMRPSLLPGLLGTMKRNTTRRNLDLRLFEIGKVFIPNGGGQGLPREINRLGLLWTGRRTPESFHLRSETVDFFDLKGVFEDLAESLRIRDWTLEPGTPPVYFEASGYVRLRAGSRILGEMGEVSGAARSLFDLKETALLLELDLDQLGAVLEKTPTFQPWPRFPGASRDISLILDEKILWQDIQAEIRALHEPLIEKVELFDLYRGKPIPPEKKNVGLRLHYRSSEQTLTEETITALHRKVAERIIGKFRAELPGGQ